MPKPTTKRKSGPPRKPKTPTEAQLSAAESQIRPARRRVSGKDRKFVALFAASGFTEADQAAKSAGFVEPGIGWKLADRLRDLVDHERVRASIGQQMELDEALRLCAERARQPEDEKVGLGYMTLILRYHGAISDKALPTDDRRKLVKQVAEVVDRIQQKLGRIPGAKDRIARMLEAGAADQTEQAEPSASSQTIDVESESEADLSSDS